MKKNLNILSVCGSGTVTSSMVAGKVKDFLEDEGFKAKTIETNPQGVDGLLHSTDWDLIVHTSPLAAEYDIPCLNAVCLLTGMGEDEFFEQLLALVKSL